MKGKKSMFLRDRISKPEQTSGKVQFPKEIVSEIIQFRCFFDNQLILFAHDVLRVCTEGNEIRSISKAEGLEDWTKSRALRTK